MGSSCILPHRLLLLFATATNDCRWQHVAAAVAAASCCCCCYYFVQAIKCLLLGSTPPLPHAPCPLASPAAFCGVLINSITIARRRSPVEGGALESCWLHFLIIIIFIGSRCGGANNAAPCEPRKFPWPF